MSDNKAQKTQGQKFREAARKAAADESEEAFDRQLKRIAKPKPKKEGPGK